MRIILPINTFKKLSKNVGVKRISDKAVKLLAKLSEEFATDVIEYALEISKSEKRTTVLARDIEIASKLKVIG